MAEEDIIIKLRLQGQQELDAAFRKIDSASKGLGESFNRFGDSVKKAVTNIGLLTAAAIGAGAALVSMTAKNAAAAEEIENLSQVTGTSVQELQVLRTITEDAGISGETAGKALTKLTKNIGELRDPTSATSKELNELSPGLRTAFLAARNGEERFNLLRDVLASTTDEVKANQLATLLLGKAGAQLLPVLQLTRQEYDAQRQQLIDLNVILTDSQIKTLAEFDSAYDRAGLAVAGFTKQLSADFAPVLTVVANEFTKFIQKVGPDLLGQISLAVSTIGAIVTDLFKLIGEGPEAQLVDQRSLAIYEGFIKIKNAIVDAFTIGKTVLDTFFAALDPIAKLFGTNGMALGIALITTQLLGLNAAIFNLGKLTVDIVKFGIALSGAIGPAILTRFPQLALAVKNFAFQTQFAWLLAGEALQKGLAKVFFEIQFAWLLALEKMKAAAVLFGGVLSKLTTVFRLLWLAVTGPIGLAIIGFTLLGAAIAVLIEKTIGWRNVFNAIVEAFTKVKDYITGTLAPAVFAFIAQSIEQVKGFFGAIGTAIAAGVQTAKAALAQGLAAMGELVRAFVVRAGDFFKGLGPALLSAFQNVSGAIKAVFDAVFASIRNAFSVMIQAVKDAIVSIGNLIKSAADAVANALSRNKQQVQQGGNGIRVTTRQEAFGPGFAGGGKVQGRGTGTSDSILARLSNGEFVIRAAMVRKFGAPFFAALNSGILPRLAGFANGGLAGALNNMTPNLNPLTISDFAAQSSAPNNGRALNLFLDGQKYETRATDDVARRLQKSMRKSDMAKPLPSPRWKK